MAEIFALDKGNPRNIEHSLRRCADRISNGELGDVSDCFIIMRNKDNGITYTSFGEMNDDGVIALVARVQHHILSFVTG